MLMAPELLWHGNAKPCNTGTNQHGSSDARPQLSAALAWPPASVQRIVSVGLCFSGDTETAQQEFRHAHGGGTVISGGLPFQTWEQPCQLQACQCQCNPCLLACPQALHDDLLAETLMCIFSCGVFCTLLVQPLQVMPCTLISSSTTSSVPAVMHLVLICWGAHDSTSSTVHQQPCGNTDPL